jgi:indole-3-glycerol phosphate synthase
MTASARTDFSLKRLVENSFSAIDQGVYELKQSTYNHEVISLRKAIMSCCHAPLITEVKFSSPSQGTIRRSSEPAADIAKTMVQSGAIGISVLTQPYFFDGSPEYLAAIREAIASIPILMKDVVVSTVQIDTAKCLGADCILLIKTVFDRNMAENSLEKFAEYATRKGLQVLVEVHNEQELAEALQARYDLIGINNRSLDNLEVDMTRTEKLLKTHSKGGSIIISESGIAEPTDIQYLRRAGADAFLVGTSIMQTQDIGAKIAQLYNAL